MERMNLRHNYNMNDIKILYNSIGIDFKRPSTGNLDIKNYICLL